MDVVQKTIIEAMAEHSRQTNAAAQAAPRCVHVKTNGVRCGSPAMVRGTRCYFHGRPHRPPVIHGFPTLEDANGVQCAVMQVANMIVQRNIEYKTASLLIEALKLASANLKGVRFEPVSQPVVTEELEPEEEA